MSKGFHIIPEGQAVLALAPTVAANVFTDYIGMQEYSHIDFLVTFGTITSACTILCYESQTTGGTVKTAIAYSYYQTSTSQSDTWSTRTAATAGGIGSGTTSNTMVCVSVDAAELTDTYEYIALHFSTASTNIGCSAILSGARYAKSPPISAID